MKIIDITRPLAPGLIVYPGDIEPSFTQDDRDQYIITDLHLSSHSGTHIDAPAHYFRGAMAVDDIPFEALIGPAQVLDCTDAGETIEEKDLTGRVSGKRLLIKTRFSDATRFSADYPGLKPDAASYLSGLGLACVGIDSPSIEPFEGDGEVHRRLLSSGAVILELLDLSGVPEGNYQLVALPLRLEGLDGSPVRAILTSEEGVPV